MLTYHDRYGYSYRWAFIAEVMWRLEQFLGARGRCFYRWRKAAETRGFASGGLVRSAVQTFVGPNEGIVPKGKKS